MNQYEFLGGDTIKITGKFKDYNETLVDPTEVTLKVYNTSFDLVDTIEEADITRSSEGIYYVDYILTDVTRSLELIFEWYGVINSKPSLDRIKVLVKFV